MEESDIYLGIRDQLHDRKLAHADCLTRLTTIILQILISVRQSPAAIRGTKAVVIVTF